MLSLQKLCSLASDYQASFEALVLGSGFYPAQMQPIVGSMNCAANSAQWWLLFDIEPSRADWYKIYKSAGNPHPKLVFAGRLFVIRVNEG